MSKVGAKGQAEYAAGYRHGLAGGEEPRREKGQSFWLGWSNGKADREEQEREKQGNGNTEHK